MIRASGQRGFIALISAIIVSSILLMVAVESGFAGFYARSDQLDAEYKAQADALADACTDEILLELAQDAAYAGPETLKVGFEKCSIGMALDPDADPRTFPISAEYRHAHANMLVTVDAGGPSIVSRREVGRF